MIKDILTESVNNALSSMGISCDLVLIERTKDEKNGDYSTNTALLLAKNTDDDPYTLAEKIVSSINGLKDKLDNIGIEKIEVAKPGFINFFLKNSFFETNVDKILNEKKEYGKGNTLKGKKIIVEYTDPNPFKEFHIGHMLNNAIGESLSRVISFLGADIKRANYQGDKGLHVAKAIWAFQKYGHDISSLSLGKSYAKGDEEYENNKEEITKINKFLYEGSDKKLNEIYEEGKKRSLENFERIYKRLGTKFDYYFFESVSGDAGLSIVSENTDNIFSKSDGAIVYRGEEKGLHTRVFVTKNGIPTYEAKELGLAKIKYDKYPYDVSVVITGNEVSEYFKVVLSAMEDVFPKLSKKTKHITHGMLRLPSGKMSSRTGDIIAAEDLIESVIKILDEKFSDKVSGYKILEEVAIGAIKYSMLKSDSGKDMIFDFEKSLSFSGDSGPYIQYTYARTRSLLSKSKSKVEKNYKSQKETLSIEKKLQQFPEVVERVYSELSPHYLANYLQELSSLFNSYYANVTIIGEDEGEKDRIALVSAVSQIIENGLFLLGISSPNKM